MEPKQYYIGIDVGGTSVKEGLFDEDGNLLAKASVPTPPIVDAAGFAAVTEAIDQVVAKAQVPRAFVAGIGLAVPCPIPASGARSWEDSRSRFRSRPRLRPSGLRVSSMRTRIVSKKASRR